MPMASLLANTVNTDINNTAAAATSTSQFLTFPFRRRKKRYTINPPDDTYNVVYLGNVLTIIAKGEECVEKPLALIWRTYCSRQNPELPMKLTVTRSGLKAETKQQGITEYWSHRITYCLAPQNLPRVFCWVYKHEGKRMKPELRCHAVLCRKPSNPYRIAQTLEQYLRAALQEYRREKLFRQNARLNALAVGRPSSSGPKRKMLLQTGSLNFRPPVNRSKSAPRLFAIDEEEENRDEQQDEYSDVDSLNYCESPIGDDACSTNSLASSTTTAPETPISGENSAQADVKNNAIKASDKSEEQRIDSVGSEFSSGIDSAPSSIGSDDGIPSSADIENRSWKARRLPLELGKRREHETDAVSEESGYQDFDDDDTDEVYYDDDESSYEEQVTAL